MLNCIKTYRVAHWLHFLGFTVLGAVASPSIPLSRLFVGVAASALLLAYAYSFNDFFDKKKKGFFPFAPLFLFAPLMFVMDARQIFFSILFVIIVTLYSLPAPRLKAFPVFGTLSNSIGFSFLFLIGSQLPLNRVSLVLLVILFVLETVAQLIHELADMKEDAKDRVLTTARWVGRKNTQRISRMLLVIAIFVSLSMTNSFGFYFIGIPTIIFSSLFFVRTSFPDSAVVRAEYRKVGMLAGMFFLAGLLFIRLA